MFREDKSVHARFARRLAEETSCPVAVPNYRLTTPANKLRHPGHTEDLHAFLHFVIEWGGLEGKETVPYDPSRLYLIGHSCSAHMLTSILLAPPTAKDPFPSLTPSNALLASIRGVVMSEGIYDIDLLLQSFHEYKAWFIADTFGDSDSYTDVNVSAYDLRNGAERMRWLVLHSKGDPLVDEVQSQSMLSRLKTLLANVKVEGSIESYLDLTHEHNEVFTEAKYHEIVSSFISRTENINT